MQCGVSAQPDAAFCSGCGFDLRAQCPGCHQAVTPEARFCSNCGNALDPRANTTSTSAHSRLIKGERRIATVLFSDLVGYTQLGESLDPEDVAQILAEIKDAASDVIETHGGTLNQFVGDEVMGLFGIPVAHDDDARRAVAAAFEIHTFVNRIAERYPQLTQQLQMHSGVQTGVVVAQARDVREGVFTATGDSVNTAARLLAEAGADEVFVGPRTQVEIAPYYETASVGALTLKGKAGALTSFKVLQATGITSRFEVAAQESRGQLAGREREWDVLSDQFKASHRTCNFVNLVGEAGIGKSRLAHEFCNYAESNSVQVLRGRCQAFGRVMPYLPFATALRRYLDIRNEDDSEAIVTRLLNAAEALKISQIHIPVLLQMLSVESANHPLPPNLNPDQLPQAILAAFTEALQSMCQVRSVLLHLEDWHWADEASLSLLPLLIQKLTNDPVLVLVDQRPGGPADWSGIDAVTIELEAVDESTIESLVANYFDVKQIQPELLHLIKHRTAGNPLFIEEVCASLRDQKLTVQRGDEVGVIGQISHIDIPRTVEAVLQSRIDALNSASKDILRLASVVGVDVPYTVLQGLSTDHSALATHVDVLIQQNLLQDVGTNSDRHLLFRHVTVQEVAYGTLLHRERENIHQRVGAVIESLYGETRMDEMVESLARHYTLAGDDDKALEFLRQAASKAARNYAFAQAREHLGLAIGILNKRSNKSKSTVQSLIKLTKRWAELNLFGPSLEQIAILETARDHATMSRDFESIATLNYWIAWVYYAVGELREATQLREQLVDQARSAGSTPMLGLMTTALGHSYASARDLRALETLREALRLRGLEANTNKSHTNDDALTMRDPLDTYTVGNIAAIAAFSGDRNTCVHLFDRAISRVQEMGSLSTESSVWVTYGLSSILLGDWPKAAHAAQSTRAISEHMRSPYHLDFSYGMEGYAVFKMGNQAEGRRLLQRCIQGIDKSQLNLSYSMLLACYADVLTELGERGEAARRVVQALERDRKGDGFGTDLAQRVRYRLASATGNHDEAKIAAKEMLARAHRLDSQRDLALAELELARGATKPQEKQKLAQLALSRFEALGLQNFRQAAQRLAGDVLETSE